MKNPYEQLKNHIYSMMVDGWMMATHPPYIVKGDMRIDPAVFAPGDVVQIPRVKRFKVQRRRFFARVDDMGAAYLAIVTWSRRPDMWRTMGADFGVESGYTSFTRTQVQYRCTLEVDLWLCVLRFSWLSKWELTPIE